MPQTNRARPMGYTKITTITPHDTNLLPRGTKGLYVQGAGNVRVQMPGAGTPFLFTGVPAGTILPIMPQKVMATGTTATDITAMG